MKIDRQVANRALAAVGQPEMPEEDKSSKSYLMIKKFYLSTLLEGLERAKWTSAKKRARLEKAVIENYTDFDNGFYLPIDCGNIIALSDKSFYLVEGKILYTNSTNPILVYVTNGKISEEKVREKKAAYETAGLAFDEEFPDYDPPEYEALFYRAFELRLASKLALELSGKPQLHQMLLQEAALFEQEGYRNSKTLSAGKHKGNQWWIG